MCFWKFWNQTFGPFFTFNAMQCNVGTFKNEYLDKRFFFKQFASTGKNYSLISDSLRDNLQLLNIKQMKTN